MSDGVNNILRYYNFTRAMQMQGSEGEQFTFYLVNEGSGDILVGIVSGANWRMRFRHYSNAQSPLDVSDLLRWLDE